MDLRPAAPADLPAIDALLASSYPALLKPDYPASVLVTALPLISRAQPRLVASGSYWTAWDGHRLLGAGGWTRGGPLGGRVRGVGHVRHVVTARDATRRGIGRAVMGAALDQARRAGIRRLECLSTRTAVPFYSALGFVLLGPTDVVLRPGVTFPAVAMRLDMPRTGAVRESP